MWKEFREFILRGNAIDLAIGVILGAAFGAVVTSLVNDVLMPPIGKAIGGVDFTNLFLVLGGGEYPTLAAAKAAGAATVNYGVFLNAIVNLLIIGSVLFLVVKTINTLRRTQPAPAPAPTEKECAFCTLAMPIRARRCPHCTADQPG
jgi:large conductance mechanosensitive channel